MQFHIKSLLIIMVFAVLFNCEQDSLIETNSEYLTSTEKLLIGDWRYDSLYVDGRSLQYFLSGLEPYFAPGRGFVAESWFRYNEDHTYEFRWDFDPAGFGLQLGIGDNYQPVYGHWELNEDENVIIHNKETSYESNYILEILTDSVMTRSYTRIIQTDATGIWFPGDIAEYRDVFYREGTRALVKTARLLYPSGNCISPNPTFEWKYDDDPEVIYELFLDDKETPVKLLYSGKSTTYSIDAPLLTDKTYYWRIMVRNEEGDSIASSEVNSFTVGTHHGTKISDSGGFLPRIDPTLVAFRDKMWVLGGCRFPCWPGTELNDVWYSEDGKEWISATNQASFTARNGHSAVVFDDKLWVIGGEDDNSLLNDVWYSENGIEWTEATPSANFSPRAAHRSTVFDGKIWIIGGFAPDSNTPGWSNDVWFSSDGIDWVQATENAPFLAPTGHTVESFNNKLWLIGGLIAESGAPGGSWFSEDGIEWQQTTGVPPERFLHSSVVYDDKIWIIGGRSPSRQSFRDLWFTEDGSDWKLYTTCGVFSPRYNHHSISFQDKIWVVGGFNTSQFLDDVYSLP